MVNKNWYFSIGALFFFMGLVKHILNLAIYLFANPEAQGIPRVELLDGMNGMIIGIGLMVFGIGKILSQPQNETKNTQINSTEKKQ